MNENATELQQKINLQTTLKKYVEEIKILKMLYGKLLSEEELQTILEYCDGDQFKAIHYIWNNRGSFQQRSFIVSDPLYSQRLLEIDQITDIQLKSQKILFYACLYAHDKKNDIFVDIIERYTRSKQIKMDIAFEYNGKMRNLLKHLLSPHGANNLKCARYLLESEIVQIKHEQITEALQMAVEFQNEDAVKLLMSFASLEEREKEERDYAANYWKEKEKNEMMLKYLKKYALSVEDYEHMMQILCESMKAIIKDQKLFSNDLFNLCWIFDKKQMWNSIFSKFTQILDLNNNEIHNDAYQWEWINQYLIQNRQLLCWLDRYDDDDDDNNNNNDIEEQKIRFEDIKILCDKQNQMEINKNMNEIKQEMEKNEKIVEELMNWKYEKQTDYKDKKNWRQDIIKYGVTVQCSLKSLLQIQMQSNDMLFHPKYIYDYDIYLNELLSRAHILDTPFQQEMNKILSKTSPVPCIFQSGQIKNYYRCKMKAQVDYADCEYPKSAQIIDIIRCQAIYHTFEDLKIGLNHFISSVKQNSDRLQIMRVKNGFHNFIVKHKKFDPENKQLQHTINKVYTTKSRQLLILSGYQDIRINLIFTMDQQSIIGEVQFLLNSMYKMKQRQQPLYEISRLLDFMSSSSIKVTTNAFDIQLQRAGLHPHALAPLMLYYPSQFQTSHLILYEKDGQGDNFVSKMANNGNVQFQCGKRLLQSGEFIPFDVVQKQLVESNNNGTYPLMYALWKQSSIECIELFVPKDMNEAKKLWPALNAYSGSCIEFAVRNTHIDTLTLLNWLKKQINDEVKWQQLVQRQDALEGMSPLMSSVLYQPNLSKEVIELLIPYNYKYNYSFWEMTCTPKFDECTLLHLMFGYQLPQVWDRLKLLKDYIPDRSWQIMLHAADTYGFTPLMNALYYSPGLNDKIISALVPKKMEISFWKLIVNQKANRTKGCTVLHLIVMNEESNILDCLKCLRSLMGEKIWQELLSMKNRMLLKETAAEMALRLKKSEQVINELTLQ